ncbi:MAG: AraC family transcriptional regulator [Clostridiales Family XIII bacterium]|jgi:two-component system response regulator YesN|nr:AraC family transcriptional regulator [Clostridiales Family XIII bacterium]
MLKALIVEHEDRDYQLLAGMVEWSRFGVEPVGRCRDGIAAMEEILRLWPDIVFTEIRMPGMGGIELIRRVREHGLTCEFVVVSRYQRFEYARSAMRLGVEEYLLKPVERDELVRVLEKLVERDTARERRDMNERFLHTRRLLRNSFMDKFTMGEPPHSFTLESLNMKYHFNLKEGVFQSAIIALSGLPKEEQEVFLPAMAESMRARFDPICHEMIPFVQGCQRLTLTFNYAEDSGAKERIRELFDIVTEHLQKRGCADVKFSVGVGLPERNVRQLKHTLETAEQAVWCGFLRGLNRLYEYGSVMFDKLKVGDILTPALLGEMNRNAAILNAENFGRAVRGALAPVTPFTDPAVLIEISRAAVDAISAACREAGSEPVNRESIEKLFLRLGCETSLAGMTTDLTEWAAEQIGRCLEGRSDIRPVRNAKRYIAEHYMETVTLEQIAERVHLNPSYFSIVFKKKTGQNFSDYLTACRIDEAKRILRDTDWKITTVCEAVGYTDSKYFSRIFTKLVGLKPSEYRALRR